MGPQVIEHIAASAVYKRPDKYTEEVDQYASPTLINRSGAPSAGEIGLNIRTHTQRNGNKAVLTGRLGPKYVYKLAEQRPNKSD